MGLDYVDIFYSHRPDPDTPLEETMVAVAHAVKSGQTLAQMALAWVLRHNVVTSALISASKVQQVDDCVGVTKNLNFNGEELAQI